MYAIGIPIIDVNDTVREVEPASFESIKGENLKWQKHLNDTDPSQLLLNKSSAIYQDYPELFKIFDRMSAERTGYGTYGFFDQPHGETIKKGCYCTTIPNRGTEMRIALTLQLV
jgi:hypothetical protein